MSRQRLRGEPALIYRVVTTTDARGNEVVGPVAANPHNVRISQVPDRSARAEVPGQVQIDVITVRCPPDLEGVNIWSRVQWRGRWYDVVAPPADHLGTRHVKHWTLILRRRPDGGGLIG